ncbi:serine hydrolase domain-containing protein [Agromyces archimandritae]|uniref:Beta-lactamase family protein n=1 Tax=Agromyces archimandritae TaxID=2781962 RepID=A0A975FNC1_9MICO|nr:serine hydrolase domain-containing protein [Agromyces archimandritae]QTX05628.1 beta-lactamase family protein [Agromyces archimandritae]
MHESVLDEVFAGFEARIGGADLGEPGTHGPGAAPSGGSGAAPAGARAPGSSVAVFDRGGLVAARGFGAAAFDAEGRVSAHPASTTAFRIASCTKSFTAAALLLLRDRGLVDLDAPITEAVPEFRALPGGAQGTPTVRMLASMSGGLPTDDPWADRQESLGRDEFTEVIAAGVRLASIPGTEYEYSNLGYALLGRVIEHAAGEPYRAFVERELLEPLSLSGTGFSVDAVPGPVATGYRRSGDAWVPLPFSGPGAFSPIGGLFSTVADLARWGGWLADAFHDGGADAGPLSRASRREMQQMHRVQRPAGSRRADPTAWRTGTVSGYGYGLNIREDAAHGMVVHHSGGYPGFSANMRWHPASGIGVVAFENATYAGVGEEVVRALDRLIEHFSGVDAMAHTPATAPAGGGAPASTPWRIDPWPDTVRLAGRAQQLLAAWNDALADEIFTPNVALDTPYAERADAIAALLAEVGPLEAGALDAVPIGDSDSPAHLSWRVPAARGELRCDILLAPIAEARIQRFRVEPAGPR